MTAPESMTYDSLVTDIQAYAERTVDSVFVAQISRFIMMAENRIASEDKPLGFKRVVNGTFNGNTLVKPARWRLTGSISYINSANKRVYLKNREYEYLRSYSPVSSVTDAPLFYADYDYETYLFAPTPDVAYPFEIVYYERPDPLSSTNQTSWTTRYAPQLLLYASLLEAMPFLKNSERIPEFQGLYAAALAAIAKEDAARLIDAGVARSK